MTTHPTAYDAVPYRSCSYPQTHPDRLATMATLYGLSPAPPARCRVLELGCGDGSNLVPMAYGLRESEFLGIDLAQTVVEKGRQAIAALGLTNIELIPADLSTATGLGTFDYVISHGLYSWVTPAVQERILGLAREVLAPQGVAYVSYNAYPARYVRNAVRQMMLWHVRRFERPAERIERARAFVRLLAEGASEHPVVSAILRHTVEEQQRESDALLFHDDLAEVNESLLFVDFVQRAGSFGLKFLTEADFADMVVWNLNRPAVDFLTALGKDVLLQQQYRDFFVFRSFRQTLLCHEDAPAATEPDSGTLRRLFAASSTRPEPPDASVASDEPVRFTTESGGEMETLHPLSKAAFLVLGTEWPRWLSVEELLSRSRARLTDAGGWPPDADDERRLLSFLLKGYGAETVELRSLRCPFVTAPSRYPRASALARLQGSMGRRVTNLRHETVRLDDDLDPKLLQLLDGSRDRAAIEVEMARFIRERNILGAEAILPALPEAIERNLNRVATLALLEA